MTFLHSSLLFLSLLFSSLALATPDYFKQIDRNEWNDLVKALKKDKELTKTVDAQGRNFFMYAAQKGYPKGVDSLRPFFDINSKDKKGQTALYLAIAHSQEKVALSLINDPETKLDLKFTGLQENILHLACRVGLIKTIENLLKKNPSLLEEANRNGETPLFEAVRAGQTLAVRALFAARVNKNHRNAKNEAAVDLIDPNYDKKLYRLFRSQD